MGKQRFKRETRELLEYAEKHRFEFAGYCGSGHIRIRHEDGTVLTISSTPSDWRGDRNKRSDIRRVDRSAAR
jgi:hypothetical protein